MKYRFFLLIIPIFLFGENFNSYYTMIEKGNYDYIHKNLPELKRNHPNDPDVLFLSGLVETNGKNAINIFIDFQKKYPKHNRADNAFIKIIEHDYTQGLYNKSIKNCSKFMKLYPGSESIENCINVMINSYHAVEKNDSANYYYNKYKKLIPHLNLTYSNSQYRPSLEVIEKKDIKQDFVSYKNKSPVEFRDNSEYKFSLQFGAFTSPTNAMYLRDKLKTKGYNAYTKKIEGRKGPLVAVRVGYFENRKIATNVGKDIKKKEKLDFMIIKTN